MTEKIIDLESIAEGVATVWKEWETRVMVLLSLVLQMFQNIFVYLRRKYGRSNFMYLRVWLACFDGRFGSLASSDNKRASNDYNSSKEKQEFVQAFCALFLLVHLGGPDAITAYSLEDDELWRGILKLVVQGFVAFYVFTRSWNDDNAFRVITIPMPYHWTYFVWRQEFVLRPSSVKKLNDSFLLPAADPGLTLGQNIRRLNMPETAPLRSLMRKKRSAEYTFKLIEVELGFMYVLLYTKATIIFSPFGIFFNSFALNFCQAFAFTVLLTTDYNRAI